MGKKLETLKNLEKLYESKKISKDLLTGKINVDHRIPAGTLRCADDLPGFVERLFCEVDNLQVLCTTCHDRKTQNEKTKTVK
jgi:5-methylcytosine-specific restriction endonuclease McrA